MMLLFGPLRRLSSTTIGNQCAIRSRGIVPGADGGGADRPAGPESQNNKKEICTADCDVSQSIRTFGVGHADAFQSRMTETFIVRAIVGPFFGRIEPQVGSQREHRQKHIMFTLTRIIVVSVVVYWYSRPHYRRIKRGIAEHSVEAANFVRQQDTTSCSRAGQHHPQFASPTHHEGSAFANRPRALQSGARHPSSVSPLFRRCAFFAPIIFCCSSSS